MNSDSAKLFSTPLDSPSGVSQPQSTICQHLSPIEPFDRMDARPEDWLVGGGEMGKLMRSIDWSKTKLGPVGSWSRSLRTMLGVVLGSRFPMLLWWGPDLLHLYNDAYRPILRDKHPASLAAPAAEIWAEVWDVAGPLARSVQQGGPATWTEDLQLFIKNGTMSEETYFTFSYSPVPGDDGNVAGILNTVQETTAKVHSERQIRMLHDLAAHATKAKSENEVFRVAAEVLSGNELDLPFVLFYLLNEKMDQAHLAGGSGWKDYDGPAKPRQALISEPAGPGHWPFSEVIRTHREIVVDNLSARFGPLPVGSWNAQPEQAIVLPLSRAAQVKPYGLLVAGVSPHRALDERYKRFFQATKDQVANVIANARAHEEERKRAEALWELDRAKTTFFSNVSHEFRTPLTLMLAPLEDELAERSDPLPKARRERLEAVHRNSLRLLKLVNTLLDFSRIEAGRIDASYEATDLAAYTAALASLFRSATEKANLTISIDCPPLPELVYVDREMWEKIVLNLVSNALKHTFRGGIRVSLRWHREHVELSVADSGVGIPEAELPRLFERFHRVKGAKSRTHEGTGIGLALVQELVSLHGGSVCVESKEGRGSSFLVSIRTGTAHLPPDRTATGRSQASMTPGGAAYVQEALQWLQDTGSRFAAEGSNQPAASPEMPTSHSRARILWADDSADLRAYVSGLLAPYYRVEAVADGAAALDAARECPPDLILSDVMMPRLDGFGLLRELRADSRTRTIPVILLSARAGEEAAIEGLDARADDYLTKPFSARELLARVRTHLELARIRHKWAKELQEANRELEAFSYSASHDLRAPLRSILGFSQILLEEHSSRLDDEGTRVLHVISESARKMGILIDDLLEFSRVGRKALKASRVDMTALAQAVIGDLVAASPSRKIQFSVGALPDSHGDPALLRQVFVNLLGNSIKYTRDGNLARIDVEGKSEVTENIFIVRDNGVGFEMEYAHKLFGIFQRLHSPEEFEGTGVGLSLVQRIIHRHGGRIWGEGKVNEGATFCFTLPRV